MSFTHPDVTSGLRGRARFTTIIVMSMLRARGWIVLAGWLGIGCGGDEFGSSGSGGSAGTGAGGSAGETSGGSGGVGAVGGGGSGQGGSAGVAGGTSSGGSAGSGGSSVTCGSTDSALLLYTTCDDDTSIQTPAQGVGPGIATVHGYEGGVCGNAARIDGDGYGITYPKSGNVDFTRGTLDFHFRPDASNTDGVRRGFFHVENSTAAGGLGVEKTAGDAFEVSANDGSTFLATTVPSSNYAWQKGQWVHITVTWDFTQPPGSVAMRVFFDGVEANYSKTGKTPLGISSAAGGESIHFGSRGDVFPAGGLLDEIKVFDKAIPPTS